MKAQERERRSPNGPNGERSLSGERCDLRILLAIRRIIRAVDVDSRQMAARYGITGPQLLALMAVAEQDQITAIDIARRIHISATTLVGVLDRLEAKGLIQRERSEEDRREVNIEATLEGRKLVSNTPFPMQYSLDKALPRMSLQEQQQVADSMDRLADLMGAEALSPAPMLEIVGVREQLEQVSPPGEANGCGPARRPK